MKALSAYPLIFDQVVAWGDMDAFGHVNNVMYYRYIESARIAYLDKVRMFDTGLICVIASSNCQYLSPVEYPDTIRVGICIEELRNSAFRMQMTLYSQQQNAAVAQGEAVVVMMQPDAKHKAAIPAQLRTNIIALEASVGNTL